MKTTLKYMGTMALLLGCIAPASAALIASYDAGVAPIAGTTGAADPAASGWVASTGSPGSFKLRCRFDEWWLENYRRY